MTYYLEFITFDGHILAYQITAPDDRTALKFCNVLQEGFTVVNQPLSFSRLSRTKARGVEYKEI